MTLAPLLILPVIIPPEIDFDVPVPDPRCHILLSSTYPACEAVLLQSYRLSIAPEGIVITLKPPPFALITCPFKQRFVVPVGNGGGGGVQGEGRIA